MITEKELKTTTGIEIINKVLENITFEQFIDNDILADFFGVEIIEINCSKHLAFHVDNKVFITKDIHYKKKRLILIHELIHHAFHIFKNDLTDYGSCEAQADKYSLILGMPNKFLKDNISKLDIYELSERYKLPIDLVSKKLVHIYSACQYREIPFKYVY